MKTNNIVRVLKLLVPQFVIEINVKIRQEYTFPFTVKIVEVELIKNNAYIGILEDYILCDFLYIKVVILLDLFTYNINICFNMRLYRM